MKMAVKALLQWRKPEEGDREFPPPGPKYSTVARFEDQKESWLDDAWSLVVEFIEPPDETLSHRVHVSYLADGPESFLRPGKTFELMEGHHAVATGKVVES